MNTKVVFLLVLCCVSIVITQAQYGTYSSQQFINETRFYTNKTIDKIRDNNNASTKSSGSSSSNYQSEYNNNYYKKRQQEIQAANEARAKYYEDQRIALQKLREDIANRERAEYERRVAQAAYDNARELESINFNKYNLGRNELKRLIDNQYQYNKNLSETERKASIKKVKSLLNNLTNDPIGEIAAVDFTKAINKIKEGLNIGVPVTALVALNKIKPKDEEQDKQIDMLKMNAIIDAFTNRVVETEMIIYGPTVEDVRRPENQPYIQYAKLIKYYPNFEDVFIKLIKSNQVISPYQVITNTYLDNKGERDAFSKAFEFTDYGGGKLLRIEKALLEGLPRDYYILRNEAKPGIMKLAAIMGENPFKVMAKNVPEDQAKETALASWIFEDWEDKEAVVEDYCNALLAIMPYETFDRKYLYSKMWDALKPFKKSSNPLIQKTISEVKRFKNLPEKRF
jgi:hypothetical protein